MDYSALRKTLRQQRRDLSAEAQTKASQALSKQLQQICQKKCVTKVAGYLAADGEISLQPFFQWCWQQDILVYVPVLHPFSSGHLLFLNYHSQTELRRNRYQLLEPELSVTNVLPAAELDLLLAPLVGFDNSGNRLGMGGGYYDRTLSATAQLQDKAIGVAHLCQQVESIPPQPWDVPLPTIIAV